FEELIGEIADGKPVDWRRFAADPRIPSHELEAARAIAGLRDASDHLAGDAPGHSTQADPVGGFEIFEEIGRGGFGRVYRARDRALGRDVALKILADVELTAAQRAHFLHEARIFASCEHPNIVRVHSVEEIAGRLELRLELVDGVTLEKLVEERGPMS